MKWYKIEIKTDTQAVEILTYLLEDSGIEGAVIEDPNDPMFDEKYKGDWDYSEEGARTFDCEDTVVKVFIEESKDIESTIEEIKKMLGTISTNGLNTGKGEITFEVVDDVDWKDKWKEYFKPFKIGSRIVIKPSWEEYTQEENDLIIEMDPGSAFGSGTHETTSMCIKHLESTIKSTDVVLDIGCGTGILGIAAAKLGAKEVIGVDIAEDAIIATNENIENNNLTDVMSVRLGNLTDVITEKSNIVVANIMADIIIAMTCDIKEVLEVGGYYITSGIIDEKKDAVLETLRKNNYTVISHLNEGGWNAILAKLNG